MKTIEDLKKVLACIKLIQAEGNQDDVTPTILEQMKAFDIVISAVDNVEVYESLDEVVCGLEDKSVEYIMKAADETLD